MIRTSDTSRAAASGKSVGWAAPRPPISSSSVRAARNAKLLVLAAVLPLAGLLALCFGSVHLPLGLVWDTLAHPAAQGVVHTIIWNLRLPRILIAMCVGAGLGLAGAALQGLFRNPLVDPYITGVSAGAALAATIGFTLGFTFALIPALAFAGGLLCAAIVAAVGAADSASGNLRLVLAGVAISALCSALITLMLLQGGQSGGLPILAWLAGGINGRGWGDLGWLTAYLAAGLAALFAQVHSLNALRLGGAAAAGLGLSLTRARWQLLATTALITAACVAVSGIVGFVGLMVPHAIRRVVSGDARWLLPGSALGGALVVVIADLLARLLLAPAEIPLGVLLAFVGVPFFLVLARRPVEL